MDGETAVETRRDGATAGLPRRRPWPEVEERLKAGLRNHWYALIPSRELGARPVALRRCGEELALWRDADGCPRLFRDACAHRGAKLSMGRVVGDGLACSYHGWTYDGAGRCIAIPTEGGACELARMASVRSYPAEELGGMIFGFLSDETQEGAPGPCPRPDELTDPGWSGFILSHHWAGARWFRALENLVDPLHGPFLHTGTYTLGYGSRQDTIRVEERPDGFFVERVGQKLINFDYAEYHFPNWFRIDIPYPWTAGPGGPMRILVYVTPIDADNTQVYMVRKRRITGWKWWLWWTLWQLRLRRKMYDVIDADEAVLVSQRGGRAIENEFLAQSDLGIVRLRRMFAETLDAG